MPLDQQKIERIKNNLYVRSVDFIDNYYNFDWHEDSDKINSSQALAIDFWGYLKLSPYKTKLINMIFNKKEDNCKHPINDTFQSSVKVREVQRSSVNFAINQKSLRFV
jgi:hypothetical protein